MRRGYKILVGTVVLISASIPFFFGASDNATELQKSVKITQESAVPTFEIEEEKEEERTASASVSVPAETKEEQTEAVSDRATPTPVAESAEPSIEIKQEEKTPKTEKPEESKEPIISVKTKAPPQDKDIEQPSCTLFVVCDDILKHPKKQSHIPANGIILEPKIVHFAENESVFDILKRELKNNGIQLEFSISPIYNTAYIEGIANIYEFDYGDTSGWMYAVNGKIPTYGCSQYILQDGDDVVFFYRCSLYG